MMRTFATWLTVLMLLLPLPRPASADPREDALAMSRQGLEAYLAGEFGLSADLYGRAYRTWPSEALYLYNAARASQRAGRSADAERMYKEYLQIAPPSQAEISKARYHLSELQSPPASAKPPPASGRPAAPAGSGGGGGIALLVIGGVAAGVGGVLLGVAASDQSALDARYSQVDGSGAIIGIDHASAQLEQSSINTKLVAGWASLGGGVALAVVGAILMARQPTPSAHPRATLGASPTAAVSIWPSGKGLGLSLQF